MFVCNRRVCRKRGTSGSLCSCVQNFKFGYRAAAACYSDRAICTKYGGTLLSRMVLLIRFREKIKDLHLLWFPLLIAFVPVVLFGTVQIAPYGIAFYLLALISTGISEKSESRALILKAVLPEGVWVALFFRSGTVPNGGPHHSGNTERTIWCLSRKRFEIKYGAQ